MSDMEVSIVNLIKEFEGNVRALDGINLNIFKGELVALLGPSGCGKTTTLRALAGFVIPDSGKIIVRGEDITRRPAYKRKMAMVFQNYALFPHMTVGQNIGFGLRMHKVPQPEISSRVAAVLKTVRLPNMENRYPHQMSGGQQQRVALARALAVDPEVLLLDEPLSNLDAKLRIDMRLEIREIVKQSKATAVYVTHDQEEALSIADRIVVMNTGNIIQDGSPREVYESPKTYFVANFIGNANILKGRVTKADGTHYVFVTEKGLELMAAGWPGALKEGDEGAVVIRHEHIRISTNGSTLARGRVRAFGYVGAQTHLVIDLSTGESLKAIIPSDAVSVCADEEVNLTWDQSRIRLVTL